MKIIYSDNFINFFRCQNSSAFSLGSSLCADAVSLVKDIIGTMDAFLDVIKSQYSEKDFLVIFIKKISNVVSFH